LREIAFRNEDIFFCKIHFASETTLYPLQEKERFFIKIK